MRVCGSDTRNIHLRTWTSKFPPRARHSMRCTPPRIVIVIPYESDPYVRVECDHHDDEQRIR
jgi:hypothetical protein